VNEATVQRLNALNRAFYQATAHEFDATRQSAWQGWQRLLAHLPAAPLRVLDVGGGNGRFGLFLHQALGGRLAHYTLLDNSAALLNKAQVSLSGFNIAHTVRLHDLIEQPLQEATHYDLVVCFGVLHHIPSLARRVGLMRSLAAACGPQGRLALTFWRFLDDARLRARLLAWSSLPEIDNTQLEEGDHLLDWRRGAAALRYCHYADLPERAHLCDATGLALVSEYIADDRGSDAHGKVQGGNVYCVLGQPHAT
jgi:tRNA (uracil-5-)-methyltransferase TRM9